MSHKKEGQAKMVIDSKIKAVHDDDLTGLLVSLNVYNGVLEGAFNCHFCEMGITVDNIASLFPQDNEIKFCCNAARCVLAMATLSQQRDKTHAIA